MPIQNRKISSQFTSPVTKRSSPDSGKVISVKLCVYHVCMVGLGDISQSCQVSRFTCESPGFRADLQVSRLVVKISRILTKIQFVKILSVFSKENPYVFVKCEIKKPISLQFVVQIKVVVQYLLKNWAIL